VIRYYFTALAAHLGRGRALLALTVFGVALGIASVLSIQIINRSALAAFRGGLQAVSGEADLSVLPRGPTMADSLYVGFARAARAVAVDDRMLLDILLSNGAGEDG